MPDKILLVNSCVRPESRTMILANRVLSKLDGDIEEVVLQKEKIRPMDAKALAENFYGIPEVIRFYAENLDIICADVPAILQKTLNEIDAWGMEVNI